MYVPSSTPLRVMKYKTPGKRDSCARENQNLGTSPHLVVTWAQGRRSFQKVRSGYVS